MIPRLFALTAPLLLICTANAERDRPPRHHEPPHEFEERDHHERSRWHTYKDREEEHWGEEGEEDDWEHDDYDDEQWDGEKHEFFARARLKTVLRKHGGRAAIMMVAKEAGMPPDKVHSVLGESLPHLIKEIDQHRESAPQYALELLEELAMVLREFRELSEVDPDLAQKFLQSHRLTYMSQRLGEGIQRMRRQVRRNQNPEMQQRLTQAEQDLQKLLSRLFDIRQDLHAAEISDLEAEVSDLKELHEKRLESKPQILEQQLRRLTGRGTVEW